ncbi:hypothetical protein [Chryseobacterium sp. SIMBA_038]|uniref:hypothetical protein n=1 Tax=Chryseobacterium sp. SIMBA_038 TaxID=3085780 RepID=UPI00397E3B28
MSTELDKLLKKKERILRELDKVYEQIALEKLNIQNSNDNLINLNPDNFEKKVRAKFKITGK